MRFVYHDPYALRGALEDVVGQQPIGKIVIEGALPGAQPNELDLTGEEGLLKVRRKARSK